MGHGPDLRSTTRHRPVSIVQQRGSCDANDERQRDATSSAARLHLRRSCVARLRDVVAREGWRRRRSWRWGRKWSVLQQLLRFLRFDARPRLLTRYHGRAGAARPVPRRTLLAQPGLARARARVAFGASAGQRFSVGAGAQWRLLVGQVRQQVLRGL